MEHHSAPAAAPAEPIGATWLLLLTASCVALVYFYGYRSWNPAPAAAPPPEMHELRAVQAPEANAADDGLVELKLPDGTVLRAAPNGAESQLIAFITDDAKPVDKTTWFTLDRLEFETSSAALRDSSNAQLDNLVVILRAYPKVKIKLGGYTDNTGDPQGNLKLSGERAASAMAALLSRGIDTARLEAEGFGEQYPVAENATPEGRARNRRTDLRVTDK